MNPASLLKHGHLRPKVLRIVCCVCNRVQEKTLHILSIHWSCLHQCLLETSAVLNANWIAMDSKWLIWPLSTWYMGCWRPSFGMPHAIYKQIEKCVHPVGQQKTIYLNQRDGGIQKRTVTTSIHWHSPTNQLRLSPDMYILVVKLTKKKSRAAILPLRCYKLTGRRAPRVVRRRCLKKATLAFTGWMVSARYNIIHPLQPSVIDIMGYPDNLCDNNSITRTNLNRNTRFNCFNPSEHP